MDLKTYSLKVFSQVYEQQSFYHASKTLHKTQSAVSQTIQGLESQLGKHLFDKKKRVQPTPFANLIYPYIKNYLEHHRQLMTRIEILKQHGQETINFAVISSFSMIELPNILSLFHKQNRDLYINISDTNSNVVKELVYSKKAEIGICNINESMHAFDICILATDRFGIVGDRSLFPESLIEITWEGLSQFKFIKNGSWNILSEPQQIFLEKLSTMSISNMTSLNTLLSSKLGISILPEKALYKDPDMKFIPIIEPALYRHIGLIKVKNIELNPITELFYQHIKNLYLPDDRSD